MNPTTLSTPPPEYPNVTIASMLQDVFGAFLPPTSPPVRYRVLSSGLRVHAAPGVFSAVLGRLAQGEILTAVPVIQVKLSDGSVWISHAAGWSCVQWLKPYMEKLL